MTAVSPQTALDLQSILIDRLQVSAKEFERKFDVTKQDNKLIIKIQRDRKGKSVFLETDLWNKVNNYVREQTGAWVPNERLWEIPLANSTLSTPSSKPASTSNLANQDILTTNLRLDELELGVFSPRQQFSPAYISELAESVEREGQHKPIIVRLHPTESNRYQVIDGEHRVRAFKKLGRNLIRAEIQKVGDREADVLAMAVNEMHGKRLEDMEEGLHLYKLMQKYGLSQEEVGKLFNKSRQWVGVRIQLARDSSEELRQSYATRGANVGQAREIVKLPKEDQAEVVKKVVEEKLPARQTKVLVDALQITESPVEKQLVLDKIPKLPVEKAKALTESLRDKKPEERVAILEKPLETFAEVYKTPESFEKGALAPPEQAVAETFTCPHCGHKFLVDWIEQTIKPQGGD